jgi:hypothetical protein
MIRLLQPVICNSRLSVSGLIYHSKLLYRRM